jgi:hypothetical protein
MHSVRLRSRSRKSLAAEVGGASDVGGVETGATALRTSAVAAGFPPAAWAPEIDIDTDARITMTTWTVRVLQERR